jgi:hypothetical protein
MGKINETVRTVNSAFRTMLFAALLGGAAFGGWKAYSIYSEPQKQLNAKQKELESVLAKLATADQELAVRTEEVATLTADVQTKAAAIAKLETSNGLLKLQHRIARINVLDQTEDAETGEVTTAIEFYEVDEQGVPLTDERQQFDLEGDRIYVECLVAKFDDKFVEENDLDRRTAVCLFQRIFGEFQEPKDGFPIDAVGSSPTAYAGEEISEFEKGIWRDFWTIANDPARAAEMGIRAAHADAPSIKLRKGGVYELDLRTTGEMTLRPLPDEAPEAVEVEAG